MMPVMRNQNWLPSLFNDFFGDEWMGMQHKHASVPAINIIENEKDFRVELAVPGTTKEDFKVNVNADNELVISLEKRSEKEEKEGDKDKKEGHRGTYLRREFSYTSFQQSFSLPDDVDRQKISAKVERCADDRPAQKGGDSGRAGFAPDRNQITSVRNSTEGISSKITATRFSGRGDFFVRPITGSSRISESLFCTAYP